MASSSPTISVAMCTFQGERYLAQQLESLTEQTRRPDQVVICDDGSTDGTRAMLREFARSAPFPVELRFNPQNLGVTRNFEQALSHCACSFAVLADQDDRWREDKLEVLSRLLGEHPSSGYACSDAELIDGDGRLLNQRVWPELRQNPGTVLPQGSDDTATGLLQSNFILGATMMINARLLKPWATPIPASWYHDHWLAVISEMLGCHGIATPEPLTFYRRHGGQTCGLRPRGLFGVMQKLLQGKQRRHRQAMRQRRIADLIAHWEQCILPARPETVRWREPLAAALASHEERAQRKSGGAWWKGLRRAG